MIEEKIRVSPRITIGPQVGEDELEKLADKGFASVVNLAGKGEFDQKLTPQEEGEKVESLGMAYAHIPVTLRRLRMEEIDEVCQQLAALPKPVYLHCLIGQRSSLLGLLFHALYKGFTTPTVFRRAQKLGISWRAPYIQSVVEKYIERTRPIREEVLDAS